MIFFVFIISFVVHNSFEIKYIANDNVFFFLKTNDNVIIVVCFSYDSFIIIFLRDKFPICASSRYSCLRS